MIELNKQSKSWHLSFHWNLVAFTRLTLCVLLGLLSLVDTGCSNTTSEPSTGEILGKKPRVVHSLSQATSLEGQWNSTGRMAMGRLLHTATLLPDGRVLATGGYNRSSELYSPATGTWSPTADALNTHRAATATLLPSGQVLVAGLGGAEWNSGISSELYAPASGTWAPTGNLRTPRLYHTATLLPDGRVLVTGGADAEYGGSVLASAELYDSATGTWTPTGAMATGRRNHTATLLSNGQVLVTGGTSTNGQFQSSAELYDPATGTWSAAGTMAVARAYHSATLLPSGLVLVAGGGDSSLAGGSSAELFNPATRTWAPTGSLASPRRYHSATLLPSGLVLVAGGFHEYTGTLTSAEVYDAALGAWSPAGPLATGRYLHTATLLPGGKVLAAGGFSNGDQASAEVYSSSSSPTPPDHPSEPAGTSVLLQVVDTSGQPVPGAVISTQNNLYPVDSSGHRLFEQLPAGSFIARVDALGYTSATAVLELQAGAHVGTQVQLIPLAAPLPFQAEQGGTVQTDQVRVSIPPGAVVDAFGHPVTGQVDVTIAPLDPTHQLAAMPGPLTGLAAADGASMELESFFMAEVSLWSNGAPVRLAPGKSATLEFLLPEALTSRFQVGDSVPAWWFDLDAGLWREEGAGTIQPSQTQPGRLLWAVTVHHFTWWNCDAPWTDRSCVNVLVQDASGNPIPNAAVSAQGVSYNGYSSTRYTGDSGRTCIEIKRGETADILVGPSTGHSSGTVRVTGTQQAAVCGSGPCTEATLTLDDIICTPGAYQACPYSGPVGTEGQGRCRAGRRQCNVAGTEWSTCQGEVLPVAESCTTPFDDNCDGSVNEGCVCSPAQGAPCYSGPAGTEGVGICHGGTVGCDPFGRATCVAQQIPKAETCWTPEDEDCNGVSEACTTEPSGWALTGAMLTPRYDFQVVLLTNGKVLAAGGNGSASAELYDPTSGTWSATGSLAGPRSYHTSTLLPDGTVLVAGGSGSSNDTGSSAELYDPTSGTWSATGSMTGPHSRHTATLLSNGKVLVVGGLGNNGPTASAELYDPASGTWSATGSMLSARFSHTATLLPNGKVLVVGGLGNATSASASAELYDPTSGTWSATGSMADSGYWHTATLLPNGKVLVAGGDVGWPEVTLASAQLYDPASGTWSATNPMLHPHFGHTATLLPNGKVLIAAGYDMATGLVIGAELYDPASGTWTSTPPMISPRMLAAATLLPNGKVLVTGFSMYGAEVYTP